MLNINVEESNIEKLTILYTINSLRDDVTDAQLTQVILGTEVMEYFTLMALLPNMLENKHITTYKKNAHTLYSITQGGLEILNSLETKIPLYFREKIDDYINKNREDIFVETIDYSSNYIIKENSVYEVNLHASLGLTNVLNINLIVDSEYEAEGICERWDGSNKEKFYSILRLL